MNILGREPVAAQGLTIALINFLITFHLVNLSDAQIGAINIFLAAVLGFFVRRSVTPISDPENSGGQSLKPIPDSPSPPLHVAPPTTPPAPQAPLPPGPPATPPTGPS